MQHTTIHDCKIIDIRKYADTRGDLSLIEGGIDIPFEIKRIYYLYMVPEAARGAHAHKELQQLMVATSGLVITEQIADEELSLPMSPTMTLEEAEEVVRLINEWKG